MALKEWARTDGLDALDAILGNIALLALLRLAVGA